MLRKVLLLVAALAVAFLGLMVVKAVASQTTPRAFRQISQEVTTIAVGSCNREERSHDFFDLILRYHPEAWVWLGDNVYADSRDPEVIRRAYAAMLADEDYRNFRREVPEIYGIYDDHDYGANDAGKEWFLKREARDMMLDFLAVPDDHPVWEREGGYQSYVIGDGDRTVKLILLDTRYFRDALTESPIRGVRYGQNLDGDVLGEAQWQWLEQELRESTAAAHLIVSSIQIIPEEHGYEKWANFPAARRRLLDLLEATDPALPLLVSGDRHLSELSRLDSLHEFTSSGLTHSYTSADEPNRHRISPLIGERNYGLLHYLWTTDGPRLLIESRSAEDDRLFFTAAPGSGMNTDELAALIHPKTSMPTTLKPCPDSPNCVSTQTDQSDKKRDPISYDGSREQAKRKLKQLLDDMPRTRLVSEDDDYLHYTFKTWPIPFIDDVEFVFDDEAKVIHYRSASRVGHSDLGVNGKRMAKVVKAWEGAL